MPDPSPRGAHLEMVGAVLAGVGWPSGDRLELHMRPAGKIGSYKLVPQANGAAPSTNSGVRRYSLARVGVSRRSALGEDRHERMERVAGLGEEPAAPEREPPRA